MTINQLGLEIAVTVTRRGKQQFANDCGGTGNLPALTFDPFSYVDTKPIIGASKSPNSRYSIEASNSIHFNG